MLTVRKKIFILLFAAGIALGCQSIARITAKSGSEFVVRVETNEPNKDEIFQQAINKLEKEMDAFGLDGEVNKISDKPFHLDVKIYEPKDIEGTKRLLFTNYQLELKKVVSQSSPSPFQSYETEESARTKTAENQEVLPYLERETNRKKFVIVEKEPIVTGKDIRAANADNRFTGADYYQINFTLKKEAGEKFGAWTSRNINNYLAVVLNKQAVSIAYIKSAIFDQGQIDGRFTKEEAEAIAFSLNSGHLPATFTVLSENRLTN